MRLLVTVALSVSLLATQANAADPLVEGARLCTQQFPVQEQNKGIPAHLLAAISSTESGRWHKQLGLALPWPWTINAEGKGYYFDSKAEAIAKTAALMRSGMRSIDVGCMQVNLRHHSKAFANLEEAFDPATNVAYGAQFLRTNYDDLGDWIKATAAYHSRTNNKGREYLARIEKSWNRIVGKVQQARARQGISTQMAAGPDFAGGAAALGPDTVSAQARSTMRPISSARNVKIIQVSDATPRNRSDVIVVRQPVSKPAVVAEPVMKVADAAAPNADMVQRTGDSIRRVTIDSQGVSANNGGTVPASSTKFVFAN